jgi:hypothetical protein
MRESIIERKLVSATRIMGGLCQKYSSPGNNGMPDRLILFPIGKAGFVEVKRQGKLPRPLQRLRHGQLRRLGFQVHVLDDPAQIPGMLQMIRGDYDSEIPAAPIPDLRD